MDTAAAPLYKGFRFPPEVISQAVWLYHRFALSFRDVEELLFERGIQVSYEAIRLRCERFGPEYARRLRHRNSKQRPGHPPDRQAPLLWGCQPPGHVLGGAPQLEISEQQGKKTRTSPHGSVSAE